MCHSPLAPPVMCPAPGAPSNGSVNASDQSYIEGSKVTYQCNDGLFPMGVFITTCTRDRQNVVWKPEIPSTVECRTAPGKIKVMYELFNSIFCIQSTAQYLKSCLVELYCMWLMVLQ